MSSALAARIQFLTVAEGKWRTEMEETCQGFVGKPGLLLGILQPGPEDTGKVREEQGPRGTLGGGWALRSPGGAKGRKMSLGAVGTCKEWSLRMWDTASCS